MPRAPAIVKKMPAASIPAGECVYTGISLQKADTEKQQVAGTIYARQQERKVTIMNQNTINHTIRIALPSGFRQMDPEEKKKIYAMSAVIPDWSVHDPERHMIFSASWKKMNSILAMMACSMDGAKGLEKRMRIALRDRNYQFGEYIKGNLGEKKAFGFTFRCQGKEEDLLNRTMMVRDGEIIYYLTSQIRADRENESKTMMDQIWSSISML